MCLPALYLLLFAGMKIERQNFLIQVKYSDLLSDAGNLDPSTGSGFHKYFLGFGAELYLTAAEIANYDSRITDGIKSFAGKNHLPLRLHAPLTQIDYSQIRNATLHMQLLYGRIFKLCALLGVNSVVAHAEFDYKSVIPIDTQFENAVRLWGVLCGESGANGIHINIENHCESEPDRLIMLMKRVDSPYLGMCVDTGHFNAFSNFTAERWLLKYPRGSVKEVHLADNKGDDDTHLPLGDGNIDFADFFETFGKRGERTCVFVLEPRNSTEARKSLSFLEKLEVL